MIIHERVPQGVPATIKTNRICIIMDYHKIPNLGRINPTFHGFQWIDTEVIQIPCGHLDNIDGRWTNSKSDED